MGPKKDTKECDESSGRRFSSRLAVRAQLEKLRAQAFHGGHLLGDFPNDPLDIPLSDNEQLKAPPEREVDW